MYDTFDKNQQDEFDHIRLILRKDYSKLQKGTTLSTESEGDEKSAGTQTADSGSQSIKSGKKLFWIDLKDLGSMSNKKMDVESKSCSDDLNLKKEQTSFTIDEEIQRNLFQILQSEVNSLANSEEEDDIEYGNLHLQRLPTGSLSEASIQSSGEECTSECSSPCKNERHQETLIL